MRSELPTTSMRRRSALAMGAAWLAAAWVPAKAQGDIVQLIVPFPPGGPADIVARLLSDSGLSDAYGRRIIVDNKPGGGGLIGTRLAARAPNDGTSFFLTPTFFLQNAILYDKPGYDPFKDFVPVGVIGTTYLVFAVNAKSPMKSMGEFVANARARGDQISYASAGLGTATHLAGFALNQAAALNMVHIPYKGEAAALQDLVGEQVSCGFFAVGSVQQYVASGHLRILGTAAEQRMPEVAPAPTMKEAGFDHAVFNTVGWFGMFAPAGTPEPLVRRMSDALTAVLRRPEVVKRLAEFGIRPWTRQPEQFLPMLKQDHQVWKGIIESAKVRLSL